MPKFTNNKDNQRIGERIKQLREKKGLIIEDVSEMTGFTRSTISNIENGKGSTIVYLIEIAKAIGVRPFEILNIPFEEKPRYQLSQKRKNQQRVTAKIRNLASKKYFSSDRTVDEVKKALEHEYKIKATSAHISIVLLRFVSEGILKSSRKGRKNLYSKKK